MMNSYYFKKVVTKMSVVALLSSSASFVVLGNDQAFAAQTPPAYSQDPILIMPTHTMITHQLKPEIWMRAPQGTMIEIKENNIIVGTGAGNGSQNVGIILDTLSLGVHMLTSVVTNKGHSVVIALPPIYVDGDGKFDIEDIHWISGRMDGDSWDFNQDGNTATVEDHKKDLQYLMEYVDSSTIVVPIDDLILVSNSVDSTSSALQFSAPNGATSVVLEKLVNVNEWVTVSSTVQSNSTGTIISGLSPKTSYTFRLSVTGGLHAGLSNPVIVRTAPTAPLVQTNNAINTIIGIDEGMEYNLDGTGFVPYSGVNPPVFSGEHKVLVRYKAIDNYPFSEPTELTYTANPVKPSAPVLSLNDVTNTMTGLTELMEISLNGGTTYSKYVNGQALDLSGEKTVKVRYTETLTTEAGAEAVITLTANPAKPNAPVITYNDATNTMTGLTELMEISLNGGTTYSKYVNGQSFDFSDDKTIKVRYAETVTTEAGAEAVIMFTVNPAKPSAPVITYNNATNTIAGLTELMEISLNGGTTYSKYVNGQSFDLNGDKTVKIRYTETMTTEAGAEVLLVFTDILVSAAPLADNIIVDTTSNSILVSNVTAGDIVMIYNKSGEVQGQAVAAPDSNYPQYIYAMINLSNLPHTGTYNVSVTSPGKSESQRVEKKYVRQPLLNIYYEQNELQVSGAEPGAKLYLYQLRTGEGFVKMQQDGTDIIQIADSSGNATFSLTNVGGYSVTQQVEIDGTQVESNIWFSMLYEIHNNALISQVEYSPTNQAFTLYGYDFSTLNPEKGIDIKGQLDWSKFTVRVNQVDEVGGINNDGLQTITFNNEDISSAILQNDNSIVIQLNTNKGIALNGALFSQISEPNNVLTHSLAHIDHAFLANTKGELTYAFYSIDNDLANIIEAPETPYLVPSQSRGKVRLVNIHKGMEWKLNSEQEFHSINSAMIDIAAPVGTMIQVRYKQTPTITESPSKELVVEEWNINPLPVMYHFNDNSEQIYIQNIPHSADIDVYTDAGLLNKIDATITFGYSYSVLQGGPTQEYNVGNITNAYIKLNSELPAGTENLYLTWSDPLFSHSDIYKLNVPNSTSRSIIESDYNYYEYNKQLTFNNLHKNEVISVYADGTLIERKKAEYDNAAVFFQLNTINPGSEVTFTITGSEHTESKQYYIDGPNVTFNDNNNVLHGMNLTMEFSLDGAAYEDYGDQNLDLSGGHILRVRYKESNHHFVSPLTEVVLTNIDFAYAFNSSHSNYIEIADTPELSPVNAITLEAWIKAESFNNLAGIVSKYQQIDDAAHPGSYSLRLSDPYSQTIDFTIGSGPSLMGKTKIEKGKWTHIAAVFENHIMKLYVNGVLDAEMNNANNIGVNNQMLRIGADYANPNNYGWGGTLPGRYFDGLISDVRIWDTARTQEQIQNNMFNLSVEQNDTIGLVGHWKLSEASVTNQVNGAPAIIGGAALVAGNTDFSIPFVQSASVSGNKLMIQISEQVDETIVPDMDDFKVYNMLDITNTPLTISNVEVMGNTIEITLNDSIGSNKLIGFTYDNLTDLSKGVFDEGENALLSITIPVIAQPVEFGLIDVSHKAFGLNDLNPNQVIQFNRNISPWNLSGITLTDENNTNMLLNDPQINYNEIYLYTYELKYNHVYTIHIPEGAVYQQDDPNIHNTEITYSFKTMRPSAPYIIFDDDNDVITNADSTMEYQIDLVGDIHPWISYDPDSPLDFGGDHIVRVRYKADGDLQANDWVEGIYTSVITAPQIPSAPVGLTADDETNTIIGLDSTMEYSIDTGEWSTYDPGMPTPVFTGDHTVRVRYAAMGNLAASEEVTNYFTMNTVAVFHTGYDINPSGEYNLESITANISSASDEIYLRVTDENGIPVNAFDDLQVIWTVNDTLGNRLIEPSVIDYGSTEDGIVQILVTPEAMQQGNYQISVKSDYRQFNYNTINFIVDRFGFIEPVTGNQPNYIFYKNGLDSLVTNVAYKFQGTVPANFGPDGGGYALLKNSLTKETVVERDSFNFSADANGVLHISFDVGILDVGVPIGTYTIELYDNTDSIIGTTSFQIMELGLN